MAEMMRLKPEDILKRHDIALRKKEETGKEIYSEFSKGMMSNVYNTESLKP